MGAKSKSNPYRTQGELAPESSDGWSDRLARLHARKSHRRGRHGAPADGSRSSRDAGLGPDTEAIMVECTRAPARGSKQGAVLSIKWQVPTVGEDSRVDVGGRSNLNELRAIHAQCVGWLYAIAQQSSKPADRMVMRQQLQDLCNLLAGMTVDVVVMGYAGFKHQLSDAAPLLREFVRGLDAWTSGAPPAHLIALARDCLEALGWRDAAQ